jgi:hypothetical protein
MIQNGESKVVTNSMRGRGLERGSRHNPGELQEELKEEESMPQEEIPVYTSQRSISDHPMFEDAEEQPDVEDSPPPQQRVPKDRNQQIEQDLMELLVPRVRMMVKELVA